MAINIRKVQPNVINDFKQEIFLNDDVVNYRFAKYLGPCEIEGQYILKMSGDVYIKAHCKQNVLFQCDFCLKKFELLIEYDLDECYSRNEDSENVYCDSEIDITDRVYEGFVLSMPSQVLCKEDCKGICYKCGTNLNEKQCDCKRDEEIDDSENPFSILKNL